jgi:hypothetical protein
VAISDDLLKAPWLTSLDVRLLAVGVPCGSFAQEDTPRTEMSIRYGGQFIPISRPAFGAWWQLLRPRTSPEIVEWIDKQKLGKGTELLNELYSAGLLLNWTGDPIADMPTFAPLRLIPLGIGMGAEPDNPENCTIHFGFVGKKVTIDPVSYTVWASSDGKTPLGEACRRGASALSVHTDEVWSTFHGVLPNLTSGGMALLDR